MCTHRVPSSVLALSRVCLYIHAQRAIPRLALRVLGRVWSSATQQSRNFRFSSIDPFFSSRAFLSLSGPYVPFVQSLFLSPLFVPIPSFVRSLACTLCQSIPFHRPSKKTSKVRASPMSAIVRVVAGTDALHRIKRRSPIQRRRLLSQCRGGGCLPTVSWVPLTTLAALGRAREKSRFLARFGCDLGACRQYKIGRMEEREEGERDDEGTPRRGRGARTWRGQGLRATLRGRVSFGRILIIFGQDPISVLNARPLLLLY